MKTRAFLLSLALGLSALAARAADPVIDALVSQIQSNPSEAAAAVGEALNKLTTGLSPQASANIAASTTTAAIDAIPATTPADEKAKLIEAIISSATKAVPNAKAAIRDAAGQSSAESTTATKRKIQNGRNFPVQRPPIIVSPSR